jgi:hypothetical protein
MSLKIRLEVTKSRSSRWKSFVRAAKKHPSFAHKMEEPETVFLTFTNLDEVNDYLIMCFRWRGLTVYLNDQKITPQKAWNLSGDVHMLREQGCPKRLVETSLKQGSELKNYVRAALERVAGLLAAELRLPPERVMVARLNMPPFSVGESNWEIPEEGPILVLDVVNSPTLWQIDLLSCDQSAARIAGIVLSALRAVAWQLDKPIAHGPLIEAAGFMIPLGGTTPQRPGRLRIVNVDEPVDASGLEPCGMRRFVYRLEIELPALDGVLAPDESLLLPNAPEAPRPDAT